MALELPDQHPQEVWVRVSMGGEDSPFPWEYQYGTPALLCRPLFFLKPRAREEAHENLWSLLSALLPIFLEI
jgi:hypothetical protein